VIGADVPLVFESESEYAESGEGRARLAHQPDEEVDDQRQDQRGQRGQAVLQRSIG
jgi:hypothetical protein